MKRKTYEKRLMVSWKEIPIITNSHAHRTETKTFTTSVNIFVKTQKNLESRENVESACKSNENQNRSVQLSKSNSTKQRKTIFIH